VRVKHKAELVAAAGIERKGQRPQLEITKTARDARGAAGQQRGGGVAQQRHQQRHDVRHHPAITAVPPWRSAEAAGPRRAAEQPRLRRPLPARLPRPSTRHDVIEGFCHPESCPASTHDALKGKLPWEDGGDEWSNLRQVL